MASQSGSSRWVQWWDIGANIAIVIACGAVVVLAMLRWTPTAEQRRSIESFRPGDAAEQLPDVHYGESKATLVLYLRSSCQYCTASMPFYRELTNHAHAKAVRIVIVSAEPPQSLRAYLSQHHLEADRALSFEGRAVPTPTLVLVGADGRVRSAWLGLQDLIGQRRIIDSLDTY
jgi:hypothetical protein